VAIGKPAAALESVAAGLKVVEKMGGSPFEAELHRLRGEALLAGAGTVGEAETAMQQGIDVARRQNAKSWELRGAVSLARLRRQQGRPQEANKLTYAYGSAAAHVAVDPGTGRVELLDYLVVEDVGRIVNPLTLHGQAIGGVVQGLGGAFMENLVYDGNGQLLLPPNPAAITCRVTSRRVSARRHRAGIPRRHPRKRAGGRPR
jgi:CO/xanthine dehydrogenase Mo-binding subunit